MIAAARLGSGAAPATRRYRFIAVALLVLAGTVNYFDRAALSVGNPAIKGDLGLSYGEMGLLLSAFAWAYGLAQIPAGALVDRFGPRRALGVSLVLWSLAQSAAAATGSLGQFLTARVALGLGESPMYIGGTRVCADWFPLKRRALPIAIFNSSSALAPALAPPILTWVMIEFGWRRMFLVAGFAGFAVAALWLLFYRSARAAGIPPQDLAEISAEDGADTETVGWGQVPWLLRFRTSWGMFLGFFGVVYIYWLYATWLPGYLESERHVSVGGAGIWTAIPLASGFLGAVLAGFISNWLVRRGFDAAAACRLPVIWGLIGAGVFTVAGAFAGDIGLAIALMSVGLFAANVSSSCGWALPAVIAPVNTVATLEAIQNVGGSLGGALAPLISGVIVQAAGSFLPAFVLAGLIAFACAWAYHAMVRERIVATE
jgi:MFS family permease